VFKVPVLEPVLETNEESAIKQKIAAENEIIIANQQQPAVQAPTATQLLIVDSLRTSSVNQNYTQVPANSQLSPTQQAQPWDGTVTTQPDEDLLEKLNLPEINTTVFETIFKNNQETIQEVETVAPVLLTKMCGRMRSILGFM